MSAPMLFAALLIVLGFSLLLAQAPALLVGFVAAVGAGWMASVLDESPEPSGSSETRMLSEWGRKG